MAYVNTSQPRSLYSGQNQSGRNGPPSSGRGMELAEIMANKADSGYIPGLGNLEKTDFLHIQQQLPLDIKSK